jgi:hypothetical protein
MAQDWAHHTARVVACMVGPLLCLVVFLVEFVFSGSSISQKMTWQKYWVRSMSGTSLKFKNMQKKLENLLCSVKTI